ncbi:MAG: hypothetical protein HKN96_01360 [Flavobacteriaceae bacterium]|nr:hypothetical protein [Flavobacteriaceae bacterium]NNK27065.1 hypothetical protein [Flavobacteriaceae bacterium]
MSRLKNAYAILIGVGDDLPDTVKDAEAIHSILSDENFAGYDPKNIYLLTNQKADRKGILEAFDDIIKKSDENSSIMLFYSGHGGNYSENTFLEAQGEPLKPDEENRQFYYLVPNGFDPEKYEETWVKSEELREKIAQINSRRLVFFLDCCHAAGMTQEVKNLRDANSPNDFTQPDGLAQKIDDGKGMSIVSSCREDQKSYIMPGDDNSLFTTCLLEVLKGEHKNYFIEPYVRISEVIQYIFREVPERYAEQRPYANLQIYDDFIMSYIPEELQAKLSPHANIVQVPEAQKSIKEDVVTTFRETENANNVLLFIHGFSGEAASTFGETPNLLMADKRFDGWDMFPLGYSENVDPEMGKEVWGSLTDIARVSDFLSTSIKFKYEKYDRVALVAYSLGGLIAQRAILDLDKENRERISHVLLFGAPSNGMPKEALKKLWNNKLKGLGEDRPFIKTLRSDWKKTFADGYPFSLKVVAASQDEFVPAKSSTGPFDKEHCHMISGRHLGMVSAEDENNDAFNLIINTLTDNDFYNQFSDEEEINILLGEYDAVVRTLMPKLDELDKRGLAKLIFALEGLDRSEEVLKLLHDHPLAENNSDLLGIVGGRYKRKYLTSYDAKDGAEAFKFYEQALKIAEEKGDHKQIYYHAINLAFLSLIIHEDHSEMTRFAEMAMDSIAHDKFPSLWKNATIGEAKLYLADFDASKEHYAKAAEKAGIREKISIHTNAYAAYTSLMQTDDPDDDFIKFLKEHFLS